MPLGFAKVVFIRWGSYAGMGWTILWILSPIWPGA